MKIKGSSRELKFDGINPATLNLHDEMLIANRKKDADKMRLYVEKHIKKRPETIEPPKPPPKKRGFAMIDSTKQAIKLIAEGIERGVIAKRLNLTLENVSNIKYRYKVEVRKLKKEMGRV
jgi:DNA-binding NarL/FixJ family response regulator